jgi:hypothetical protein
MEAFFFLAPMVICAHPPHHPSGFFSAYAGNRFWMSRSDHSHHPIILSLATEVMGLSLVQSMSANSFVIKFV